jgi:predicted XRE-type DNA-binding protein
VTAEDFRVWLERRNLNQVQAAPLLAARQNEISRWASGTRKIPPRIARIVELLDALEKRG